MATGRWFYAAIAAISGVMIIFEFHLLTIILISIGTIRIILERQKKLLFFYCLFFIFFVCLTIYNKNHNVTIFDYGFANMHITFKEVPEIDGDRLRAVVVSDQENLLLSYKIQSEVEKSMLEENIRAGATCYISGELIQPEQNRNEYAFSYKQYLYTQHIHWLLETSSIDWNDCYYSNQTIINDLQNIREKGVWFVEKHFPDQLIPYANALIFGDRSSFPEDTFRSYQQIGVVHLLAISGLHIAFLVGLIYVILLRLGISKDTIYWLLHIILPIYMVICGLNPPVIRAVLMSLLLLSAKKWRLPITTLDALSISFIIFLLFDPFLIYHPGFQLSFCVTFCLIISSKAIFAKNPTYIKTMLEISVVSTLASFPILAFHFFEFSVIGILANVIFVPFYTAIILPAMLSLFVVKFFNDWLFQFFSELIATIVFYSEKFALLISAFKYSTIITGKPNSISIIFMIIGAYLYVFLIENNKAKILAVLPLTMILLINNAFNQFSPKGEVIFIDIGQGDSTLIKLPYNRGTYLIDTGGQIHFSVPEWQKRKKPFQIGTQILLPVLKSKGIHKIDKLILTHSDADHIGAAKDLFGEITIKKIYISPNSWDNALMEEILYLSDIYGIPISEVKAGSGWENKSGIFQFIFPLDDDYEGNNSSLVLFAAFGGLKWLFMGDIEKEGEKVIMDTYAKLDAHVLKVGHHGSKTSTTIDFVKFINPNYAVISAGHNNRYGHPHQDVLDVLEDNKVHIFRTDIQGAIHYVFVKRSGTFQTILQ
ncbi:DNA internalization-related competence protein ComEC/Rec2 [Lederbergia wuyishanensis]|uniref:Competence protein ComEC n=1 Tax=Lederbergia wuyishanensis TaxID=1347903 RepID=A0ABU0D1M1_9BACI|nr:DNA internalization-related competence protein ComEC/Rec2 [Lederbergia wuyishanensis]MCJ8006895.1 DNA internalization-related competence protein ComEC/Rec2 [Lederbergia wuyishanensis]MDQ0342279.1 competence protein ComEC [Lederbergia wuyishanensis]